MNNSTIPIIDLDEIDGNIIIGRYEFTKEDERITVKPSTVNIVPDITVSAVIGNTRYMVTGSYTGNKHIEDKVSQIIKREMEAR